MLARWSGWGAVGLSEVFNEAKSEFSRERSRLHELLDDKDYAAARLTTINAHYTDPMVVRQMWRIMERLGFDQGIVLEPGCGAGTFIGMAPPSASMVGVELDPTTAAIAGLLYPDADIRCESFAATRLPAGYFDAAIGNVPFSSQSLYDPLYNSSNLAMHNHFIVKALALTRPGGIVAALTSSFTLDAKQRAARAEIASMADLVGAIRLPNKTFARCAGTDVMIDLVVFRKRADDPGLTTSSDLASQWIPSSQVELTGPKAEEKLYVSDYFQMRPDMVLGQMKAVSTQYGVRVGVEGDLDQLESRLSMAADRLVADAQRQGLEFIKAPARATRPKTDMVPPGILDGHVERRSDGTFVKAESGQYVALPVKQSQVLELARLMGLRDKAVALLRAERDGEPDTDLDGKRESLRLNWQRYVSQFGPVNRFISFLTAADKQDRQEFIEQNSGLADGEDLTVLAELQFPASGRRIPPAVKYLADDPDWWRLAALENFDEVSGEVTPGALLRKRLVRPDKTIVNVDNVVDALAVVLDQCGRVDLDRIRELAGLDSRQVIEELGDLIWQVPGEPDLWKTKAAYLSGNVRTKLRAALEAESAEPGKWQHHVDALTSVLPPDILPGDISARPGAVWISGEDHQLFLQELLHDPNLVVTRIDVSDWRVRPSRTVTDDFDYTEKWGTSRMPATNIFTAIAEQRRVEVHDTYEDSSGKERRSINEQETDAAQEKADLMIAEFKQWLWSDPDRSIRLTREYNDKFNAHVGRDYRSEGQRLSLPGLSPDWIPRVHQRDAVARGIAEPSVGLFHEVGAGKTMEMVMICMELKRLGMVSKPAFVVPNHMLAQFGREFMQLYPQANLRAVSSAEVDKRSRRRFVAAVASGDFDAVIMTYGAFERIPLQPATVKKFIDAQVSDLKHMVEKASADLKKTVSVKRLETRLLARIEKIHRQMDSPRDVGVSFEETGIDYLLVDELHNFKNLATWSSVSDGSIQGSRRAMDLLAKIEYLRSLGRDRVITGATATPVANSVSEMHVMMKYLAPQILKDAGMYHFDEWVATFAEVEKKPEITATGDIKFKSRLARFVNVPELQAMFRQFADVKRRADLDLDVPQVVKPDGTPGINTVVLPRSEEQQHYFETIIRARIKAIENRDVEPEEDNHLTVHGDGRRATLDMRLIDPACEGGTKVLSAGDLLHSVWEQTKDNAYLDPDSGE
ncbi:MAG: helicase, partial [Propionibacteriaceae bacterium]|nr:helicase [Propionibacteriaceae bacterium]